MKTKYIAAAIVSALALTAALPASAQDYRGQDYGRGGYSNDYNHGRPDMRQDWRTRGQITIRTQRGQFTVDRHDPMFYRLTDRPYRFRPGFTYIYTDRCNRDGCMVLEFAAYSRQPTDRFFAPYLRMDRIAWNSDDRWRQDDQNFRGPPPGPQDFNRNGGDRDFRNDAPPPPNANDAPPAPDRGPPPQAGGQYNGNGYHRDNSSLLGGRN